MGRGGRALAARQALLAERAKPPRHDRRRRVRPESVQNF